MSDTFTTDGADRAWHGQVPGQRRQSNAGVGCDAAPIDPFIRETFARWADRIRSAGSQRCAIIEFGNVAREASPFIRAGVLDKVDAVDRLSNAAEAFGLTGKVGIDQVQAVLAREIGAASRETQFWGGAV